MIKNNFPDPPITSSERCDMEGCDYREGPVCSRCESLNPYVEDLSRYLDDLWEVINEEGPDTAWDRAFKYAGGISRSDYEELCRVLEEAKVAIESLVDRCCFGDEYE